MELSHERFPLAKEASVDRQVRVPPGGLAGNYLKSTN